ncbi:MAG: glycosyltransferase family 4 protein [Cyclobacteriaceae bacterium]
MKILFVQKEGGIFGAENYQLKIIPELIRRGYTIHFLRLYTNYQGGKGGKFIDLLNSFGVKTFENNIGRFINPVNLFRINQIIKSEKYDLIHTHLIHADIHLALIKLLLNRKMKVVSTKHGYDNAFTAKHGFNPGKQTRTPYFVISRFAENLMTKSFTITNSLRNFFIQTGLTTAAKMSTIHYGFDFTPPELSWGDDRLRIFKKQLVIAGRLVRFKGHRFVIEAMPEIVRQNPDAGLVIVGSGELEAELKALVSELQMDDHVRFTGYSSDVVKWMYNSQVVCVPSISEGFGVVLLEAFNCSKPVVAFDVPACNELMQHNKTGLLVEPFDTAMLSKTICKLLNEPQAADDIGRAANRRLKEYFTLKRMTDQTESFYKSVN